MKSKIINKKKDLFVWIDLEMTGLNVENDLIIELAIIITDSSLNTIAEGPNLAIYQSEEALAKMSKTVCEMHTKTGLIDRVRKSTISEAEAENIISEFIIKHINKTANNYLCGNSIYQDKKFLDKYMPKITKYLHYRLLDISTLKILAQNLVPSLPPLEKTNTHQALQDIKESINELAYYYEHWLKPKTK